MQVFLAIGLITVVLMTTFATIVVDRFKVGTAIFAHRAALGDAGIAAAFTAEALEDTAAPKHLSSASVISAGV